jgi:hypothetical protein
MRNGDKARSCATKTFAGGSSREFKDCLRKRLKWMARQGKGSRPMRRIPC